MTHITLYRIPDTFIFFFSRPVIKSRFHTFRNIIAMNQAKGNDVYTISKLNICLGIDQREKHVQYFSF